MRTWKRAPNLGPETSRFSRRYFFSLAILAMALMSSYYWAGFPFDNVCATDQTVSGDLVGRWAVMTDPVTQVTVEASDPAFQCM